MNVSDWGHTLGLGDSRADHVGVRAGVGDGLVVGHHVLGGGGHGGRIVEVAASGEHGELADVLRKHLRSAQMIQDTLTGAPHCCHGRRERLAILRPGLRFIADAARRFDHNRPATLFHAATKCTRSDPGS